VTEGNVVSPSSGTLATIVSQDPMYVVFPISLRTDLELRDRYADKGGFSAVVIKLRLPNGKIYGHDGTLNFVDNTVSPTTDTIILRGTIPNPTLQSDEVGHATVRELVDGEFVTVLLQGVQPVELVTVPRAAVLSDQRGDYVFTVDAQNKVAQTRIQLGQSTPGTASVISGLDAGTMVIVDGVQRVRPGQVVQPGPASPPLGASPATLQGGTGGGAPAGKSASGSSAATPASGGK
jgi:membrane fusion protein (multidrug efflux system)